MNFEEKEEEAIKTGSSDRPAKKEGAFITPGKQKADEEKSPLCLRDAILSFCAPLSIFQMTKSATLSH